MTPHLRRTKFPEFCTPANSRLRRSQSSCIREFPAPEKHTLRILLDFDVSRVMYFPEFPNNGRPLYTVARRAPTRSQVARRACNSPPPWPIKGEASPQPRGTGGRSGEEQAQLNTTHRALTLLFSHNISSHSLGTWRPRFLSRLACTCPTTSTPGAEQYSATSTPLLDVRPPSAGTRIKPCVICCLASTIEG
jgi:hypothetical protein